MTATITRRPQGIPTGGQFAPTNHTEPAVSLDAPLTREQALDTSTLVPGQPRLIGPDIHGIEGIDTITMTDRGPLKQANVPLFIEPSAGATTPEAKHLLELRYALPAEANIAELYEFDDWSYRGARAAAQSGLEDYTGLGPKPWSTPESIYPATKAEIDGDGNIAFTAYESFAPSGDRIDPEDFESWASEYSGYTDPQTRQELGSRIRDSYYS